jgi:hypothetical protein
VPSDGVVNVVFSSPSRPSVELTKALEIENLGFFSFTVTDVEANQLIDNSYSYVINYGDDVVALGNVRIV